MPLFGRAAIIGVGMIGASIARAMKKNSLAAEVAGSGRTMENLSLALESGYVDTISTNPSEAVSGADLVVLATGVDAFEGILADINVSLKPGALVVDVGSVKGSMVKRVQSMMPEGVEFVGCHPIAGNERAGAGASVEGLFEGAVCIITPIDSNTREALKRATALWEGMGSVVRTMDTEEHDVLLGLVSHFPHLAAYAMVNAIEDTKEGAVALSGAGLKDTTRIAMSPSELWRDISMLNRDNIIPALSAYISGLEKIKGALEAGDASGLEKILALARKRRSSIEG